jgi:hypothetical protein
MTEKTFRHGVTRAVCLGGRSVLWGWLLLASVFVPSIGRAATELKTGEGIFPSPSAVWSFEEAPFVLKQITESRSGRKYLVDSGRVKLVDGKTAAELKPDHESLKFKKGGLTVNQEFAAHKLNAEQRVTVKDDTLVWDVILNNASAGEKWIEVNLALPVKTQPSEHYWDGREEKLLSAAPFSRKELDFTFPVSLLYGPDHGLAIGVPPTVEASFLENGIGQDGRMFYRTRLVVFPGKSEHITFLIYLVKPTFGSRDAVHGYYRRFPASFEPTPGVDPRLVDGRRTGTLQLGHFTGGIKDAEKAVLASQYYGGYDWSYTPFRYEGDFMGRKEYWDFDNQTEGQKIAMKKSIEEEVVGGSWDRTEWSRFHQTRLEMFRKGDLRGNLVMAFYIINQVEKSIAEKGFPGIENLKLPQGCNALPYSNSYMVYPWASAYEKILRRDFPELVKELNLHAFAHDNYGVIPEIARYRKPLDYYLPGWSYDNYGAYISPGLGFRHAVDYIHTLRQGGRPVGLIANGIDYANPLQFLAPDAFIAEAPMQRDNNWRERGIHCRLFAGHKPVYHHAYSCMVLGHISKLGDVVPWETLTPEQCRAVYDDFVRDYVMFLYQGGQTPPWEICASHEVVGDELPIMLEVMGRGFEPTSACVGVAMLERARYGAGLGAAVVLSNRSADPVKTEERLIPQYLGETGAVLPSEYRGGELKFNLDARGTVFPLTVGSMENKIVSIPVALRADLPISGSGLCVTELAPLSRTYRLTLKLSSPVKVRIAVVPDPGFELGQVTCNGKKVALGERLSLAAGDNALVVKTVSDLVRAPLEALTGFPMGEAAIALPDHPSERESAAAQMVQDFVQIRLKKSLALLGSVPAADRPLIRIARLASGEYRGVSIEKGALTVRGKDPFDTQQVTWDLLRFLDRYDPRFGPSPFFLEKTAQYRDESTRKMLEKAGLLNPSNPQRVRGLKVEKRLAWNGFAKKSTPALSIRVEDLRLLVVPQLKGEPVLDGKLDDPIWKSATETGAFSILGHPEALPTQVTETYVFRTEDAIFVGFKCHETSMGKIVMNMTERDSQVWLDDTFEVRLAPGGVLQSAYPYYAFIVNAMGTQTDLRVENHVVDAAWNADWKYRAHRDAAFWSGEMRIPLKAMENHQATSWRVNFSRGEKPNVEYSTWAPIPETLVDQPGRFGTMQWR